MNSRFSVVLVAIPAWMLLLSCAATGADKPSGEQIYQKQCVRCHGVDGAGTKEYAEPLVGDRSVAQLSKYIAKTMPEDKPGTCVGDDADKVAAYIHEAFYSQAARERSKEPVFGSEAIAKPAAPVVSCPRTP